VTAVLNEALRSGHRPRAATPADRSSRFTAIGGRFETDLFGEVPTTCGGQTRPQTI
jgi:hypothetical protein